MPDADSLVWVLGEHKHIEALKRFVCADPPKAIYDKHRGKFHPKPWELETQAGLRGLTMPMRKSQALLLGLDADGEIAVACWVSLDDENKQLLVLAIATRYDLRGNGLGSKALDIAVKSLLETRRVYAMDCGIFARIHRKNEPSQKLFTAAGFQNLGLIDSDDLEVWVKI